MSVVSSRLNRTLTIKVGEVMDFKVHHDFRQAYENEADGILSYVVDLDGTLRLDSSALGMLLLLRDYAGGDRDSVLLANVCAGVWKTLATVNFEALFRISAALD